MEKEKRVGGKPQGIDWTSQAEREPGLLVEDNRCKGTGVSHIQAFTYQQQA